MEDKKDLDIGMEDGGRDENKKLVDKFLTIKVSPDIDKKRLHFEEMLEAFRNAEAADGIDARELSDEEIDFVAAAGTDPSMPERRLQERFYCNRCGKRFKNNRELSMHQPSCRGKTIY